MSCVIKRILNINTPIRFAELNLFDDRVNITDNCQYSWSTDNLCWSNWVDYKTYKTICPNLDSDFYLRILLFGGFSNIAINGEEIKCYNICLYNENIYTADLCENNLFNPYQNLDCALQLQQQMSDLICCIFGIPCYYFSVQPDRDTADYTFKEYVLHNVVDMKYIKLLCTDGQLPSSKPQMTEFDFDWNNDWEVEVGKTMFAKAFGDDAFPKQRDIIYIPMMKRIYEVNAAYDEKQEGLMWRSTTWKLALVKYNDKTNILQGDFENIIDDWIVNNYDDMHVKEKEEQLIESGTIQTDEPNFSPNTLTDIFMSDAIRKSVTTSELSNVTSIQINNNSTVVARNCYEFAGEDSMILYQKPFCAHNGTVMFIINIPSTFEGSRNLINIAHIKIDISRNNISFNGLSQEVQYDNTYYVICRWNRNNFTSEMNIYNYICTVENIPLYNIRPEMYKFDYDNPLCELTIVYNNDFIINKPVSVRVMPGQVKFTNFKLYDDYLNINDSIKESIKYSTKNEHLVINDIARPFIDQYGFSVR